MGPLNLRRIACIAAVLYAAFGGPQTAFTAALYITIIPVFLMPKLLTYTTHESIVIVDWMQDWKDHMLPAEQKLCLRLLTRWDKYPVPHITYLEMKTLRMIKKRLGYRYCVHKVIGDECPHCNH